MRFVKIDKDKKGPEVFTPTSQRETRGPGAVVTAAPRTVNAADAVEQISRQENKLLSSVAASSSQTSARDRRQRASDRFAAENQASKTGRTSDYIRELNTSEVMLDHLSKRVRYRGSHGSADFLRNISRIQAHSGRKRRAAWRCRLP